MPLRKFFLNLNETPLAQIKEFIMKRLLLIVLPMLLLLVQCASEDSVESMLIGKWQPETI